MTFSTALSTINTPIVTGSLGILAGWSLPQLALLFSQSVIGTTTTTSMTTIMTTLPMIKLLNLMALSLSLYSVSQPGRLDGADVRSSTNNNSSDGTDTTATTDIADIAKAVTTTRNEGSLFVPKGWAFIIWAPIFLGEFAYVIATTLFVKKGTFLGQVFQKSSAGFIVAQIFQVLWTATFRPKYYCSSSRQRGGIDLPRYMSSIMLTGIAASLNRAHIVYTTSISSSSNGSSTRNAFIKAITFLPLSLHFGWTTAASLVNWNGSIAAAATAATFFKNPSSSSSSATTTVAVAGWTSVIAATVLSVYITLSRSAPIYGLVICWALTACADTIGDRLLLLPSHQQQQQQPRDPGTNVLRETTTTIMTTTQNRWFNTSSKKVETTGSLHKRNNNNGGMCKSSTTLVIQRWLCVVGAVISGAAAVWTTIPSPNR